MKKTYLEIGSSVGSVLLFIILIVIMNDKEFFLHTYAGYGNVIILILFVVIVGFAGIRLAVLED